MSKQTPLVGTISVVQFTQTKKKEVPLAASVQVVDTTSDLLYQKAVAFVIT